jgi:Fe2+ transport system protein B
MDSRHERREPHANGDAGAARSAVVNRTHRIIREEALKMREQRTRSRSLLAPVTICSALLLIISYAVWAMMAGYDLTPTDVPDASDQVLLFLLWSLPVTVAILAIVWLRRRSRNGEQTL